MAEIGIDISGHRSKSIDEFKSRRLAHVVMVCDEKPTGLPVLPRRKGTIYHHAFTNRRPAPGPTRILACFRRSRDEIRVWIAETFIKGKREA